MTMTNEEYFKLLEQEEKVKCIGCGLPIGIDIVNFPPDKYNYCHSFCCWCCPDANKHPCDKEVVETKLIGEMIGK